MGNVFFGIVVGLIMTILVYYYSDMGNWRF